jgi:hypothetical protein
MEYPELLTSIQHDPNGALVQACKLDYLEIIEFLFDEVLDVPNYQALWQVARRGSLQALKLVMDRSPDYLLDTEILIATVQSGSIEKVKLVQRFLSRTTERAIFEAAELGHLEILNLLRTDDVSADSLFDCAVEYNQVAIIKYLLNQGHISLQEINRGSQHASRKGYFEIVQLCLQHGGDPNNGSLDQAIHGDHLEITQFLLESGARVSNTELRLACRNGHPEIIQLLLKHGADSKCVLKWAAEEGHIEIVRDLLNQGVWTYEVLGVTNPEISQVLSEYSERRRRECFTQLRNVIGKFFGFS